MKQHRSKRPPIGEPGEAKEARRQEILSAAARLLATYGYHGMAMRDLARATGTSLANLYNYFSSKDDLVFALQTRAFDTLISTAGQAVAGLEGAEARLYAFILNHVRYMTTHGDVARVLVEEAGELPPRRRRAVRELKERYFGMAREIVVAVNTAGCGVPGAVPAGAQETTEVDRSTYNIFGMLNWVYGWYDAGRHGSPQEVARSIHRIALCGLVARCPSSMVVADMERRVGTARVPSPVALLSEA
ncbi:MAG TPA: TetR/AcrR family transcriptional regulator [Vicinamibacterales bacterium]|nr:TetR/AcrR family transcriptional regulator [Vicinamibacterales bacterium]